MTKDEALAGFQNLYNEIDKDNHLFVGTINPEWIQLAIKALEQPQIIRCKDCINQGMNDCPMWEGMITEDYMWCCEGEKK